MQRIMQAQALGDSSKQAYMQGKKTMEINPRHPLIVGLLDKVQADAEDASAADTARLLFETALLESGYPMQDHQAFASRVWPSRSPPARGGLLLVTSSVCREGRRWCAQVTIALHFAGLRAHERAAGC